MMVKMEEEEEEEEQQQKKNKKLKMDWNLVFQSSKQESPLPELVVVGGKTDKHQEEGPSVSSETEVGLSRISDNDLIEKINRMPGQIKELAPKLPDNGAKLRKMLKEYQQERERRARIPSQKKAEELKKPRHSQDSHSPGGVCNGFISDTPTSQAPRQSSFTSIFSRGLEEKPDCSTHITVDPSRSELCFGRGNHQNSGSFPNKQKRENKITSRKSPFRCPGAQKTIPSSTFYHIPKNEKLSSCPSKRRKGSEGQNSLNSRTKKNQMVVLVDEEDSQSIKATHQEDEPTGRKETIIYYPSRDDPESVELRHSDLKCLDPETFLSSTIMNFYIRYLQRPVSATGRSQTHYHFFNTYFYGKIKEAVSYKGNDKDKFFLKFRRWWKGVNIFEKAYILLPIHETLHWSLVIICIPDKEDESGPIILHLDSLGFHISSQIFQNVRSFLREEWNYLNGKVVPQNFPISERIWKHLPRRIDDKIIRVPQQKNDYDCGIFVLYFMERFMQEAPERLRKKDVDMFSRHWFKHEEASGLRKRIRHLLLEEFDKASLENEIGDGNEDNESSPTSSGDDPVGCTKEDGNGNESKESSPTSSGDSPVVCTINSRSR